MCNSFLYEKFNFLTSHHTVVTLFIKIKLKPLYLEVRWSQLNIQQHALFKNANIYVSFNFEFSLSVLFFTILNNPFTFQ